MGHQAAVVEVHELIPCPVLTGNTERTWRGVELPHQLNTEVAFLGKGPVCALQGIPAQLAACLLQSGNRAGRRHAAAGHALAEIPVSARLLQLADLVVQVRDVDVRQHRHLHAAHGIFAKVSVHVDDTLV